MIIANFTPDTIEWQHVGILGVLEPEDIKEFDNHRGMHILNKYGMRGLLTLQFGEDKPEIIEEKRAAAMAMWKKFWIQQISYHNQHNEALKNAGKSYISPTDEISEHAKKLGIDVIGPWDSARYEKDKELESLRAETAEMRKIVNRLMMDRTATEVAKSAEEANEDIRKKFKSMTKEQLQPFVNGNAAEILTWPMLIVLELKEKYKRFYGDDSWPLAT